jgi:hypothetical protein
MDQQSKVDNWKNTLKNNKYTAPIIFIGGVLLTLITFGKEFGDAFLKNHQLEKNVQQLTNNLDTIKQSLRKYDFAIVNNKAEPTANNIYYSKNATGVNYGQVGDVYNQSKTYNQTKLDNSTSGKEPEKSNSHIVEIESPKEPVIRKEGQSQMVDFSLKTKGKEEANNINSDFGVVYKIRGNYADCGVYGDTHPTVITSYPTTFSYGFEPPSGTRDADTVYIFLRLKLTNNIGESQMPYQVIYRKCKANKPIRLVTGTKEYKEIIERILVNKV